MSRIFINYRRQDSEGYVGRLYDHLAQHFPREDLFMDVDNIPPGADFVQVLEKAVNGCDVFIAVIGPQWVGISDSSGQRRLMQWNDFVRIEIASALQADKLVIPVLVGGARMPAPQDLPADLTTLVRRNAIELTHQRFGYDVGKLIAAIKDTLPARAAQAIDSAALRQRETALKAVRDDLVNASASPLYAYRIENRFFPVLGEGSPNARIIFIGEAPGKSEGESGRPFVGPSGEILEDMLRGIGLRREDVYLTNAILDRPPDQRDPTPEELAFYSPFLDRLIDIIRPNVIATLGRFAMDYMLKKVNAPEKGGKISQLHGKLIKTRLHYGDIHIVPFFHPAAVLYSPSQKEALRKDFQKLKLFI
ncbi:MAG: TIR domain-containing protein [Chloroflexi bacterium]|nr:TIR domain-containing protein [Chloroflexota bacterium]